MFEYQQAQLQDMADTVLARARAIGASDAVVDAVFPGYDGRRLRERMLKG